MHPHLRLTLLLTASSFLTAQDPVPAPAQRGPAHEPARLKKGDTAPAFTVEDAEGKPVKLSDFAKQIVIVDVNATWCGPCQAAMPNNDRIQRKYADQGVVLLAVCSNDTRENYRDWQKRNADRWKFRMLFDSPGKKNWDDSVFNKEYHVTGWPAMFVIGRDGKLVEEIGGGGAGEDYRLEYALARAGAKVDLASLPPEPVPDPNAPKSVPMVGKVPAIRMGTPPVGNQGLLPDKFGSVAQGAAVPDFTVEGPDGKPLSLSSLKGKRVLLQFHTAGGPSAWLEPIAKAYADQNVATLCVFSATDKETFDKWQKEHQAPGFLVAWDKAGKAWTENVTNTTFGIGMYPATAVVGADGKLVSGTIGMGDKIAVMVKAMLAKAGVKLNAEDQAAVAAAEAKATPPATEPKK
jgi:peroxiredoxin